MVNHDPRNRGFVAPRAATRKSVKHRTYGAVLDQDGVGACTGFATAAVCNTVPTRVAGSKPLTNADGFDFYRYATANDSWDGAWEPIDTGSDGLSAAKAARARGLIREFRWAFGLDASLDALVLGAVSFGTEWPESFDHPDSHGRVRLSPGWQSRGGHQWCANGVDFVRKEVRARQSWGDGWGDHGTFYVSFTDLGELLDRTGDCAVLVR